MQNVCNPAYGGSCMVIKTMMANYGKPDFSGNHGVKNLDCSKLWWKSVENSANGAKVTNTWIAPNYNGKPWENCSMVAICSPTIKTWIDPKYGSKL
ncbi:hypothetical protein CDAR_299551 [Caerostris darwini]|uniref:Uncharacterized protein n=1 Tax=Caerostris darwini TaxID=1538125 RepID=A0AAV4RNP4_9ARAC|nr:hypothetical protein CDAR_299551 [Caerostris darwini]